MRRSTAGPALPGLRTPGLRLDAALLGAAGLVACQTASPPPAASSGAPALPSALAQPPATPRAEPPEPAGSSFSVVGVAAGDVLNLRSAADASAALLGSIPHLRVLEPLICFGNEPFWGIQFKADGSATCEATCEGPPGLRVFNVTLTQSGDPQGFDLLDARGDLFLRGVLRRTDKCSDGMSDNVHPYVFTGTGKRGPFDGCCRDKRVQLRSG